MSVSLLGPLVVLALLDSTGFGTLLIPWWLMLAARMLAAGAVEPALGKLDAWMVRTGRENTAWILGIVGFLLPSNAQGSLLQPAVGPQPSSSVASARSSWATGLAALRSGWRPLR